MQWRGGLKRCPSVCLCHQSRLCEACTKTTKPSTWKLGQC